MHDCSTMESKLVDLIFDELDVKEKQRLLAEIDNCAACLSEYRSLTKTMLVFDQAVEVSVPDESYWPAHHEALRQRLETLALPTKVEREPFWKRILLAKLPVPVPVAAVIVLGLLVSSVLALRPSTQASIPAASYSLSTTSSPPRVIEVPVIREKVVTRTIYVEKKAQTNPALPRQSPTVERTESPLMARNPAKIERQADFFTRASLTNYQPPDEMKIRIIKRRNSDEN
jgi:anti-sigma factor RsiW